MWSEWQEVFDREPKSSSPWNRLFCLCPSTKADPATLDWEVKPPNEEPHGEAAEVSPLCEIEVPRSPARFEKLSAVCLWPRAPCEMLLSNSHDWQRLPKLSIFGLERRSFEEPPPEQGGPGPWRESEPLDAE